MFAGKKVTARVNGLSDNNEKTEYEILLKSFLQVVAEDRPDANSD